MSRRFALAVATALSTTCPALAAPNYQGQSWDGGAYVNLAPASTGPWFGSLEIFAGTSGQSNIRVERNSVASSFLNFAVNTGSVACGSHGGSCTTEYSFGYTSNGLNLTANAVTLATLTNTGTWVFKGPVSFNSSGSFIPPTNNGSMAVLGVGQLYYDTSLHSLNVDVGGVWTPLLTAATAPVVSVDGSTGAVTGLEQTANKDAASGYAGLTSGSLLKNVEMPPPTVSALGGAMATGTTAHNFLTKLTTAGTFGIAQPAFNDISGTIAASQLVPPTVSTLGGVEATVAVSHNFLTSINTLGVVSQAQPSFGDVSGTIGSAQLPFAGAAAGAVLAGDCSTGSFAVGVASGTGHLDCGLPPSVTITDGTTSVSALQTLTVSGGAVSGSAGLATLTITGGGSGVGTISGGANITVSNGTGPNATVALSASPTLTTQAASDNSTKAATTAYVKAQGLALPWQSGRWYFPPAAPAAFSATSTFLFFEPIYVPSPVTVTQISLVGSGTTGSSTATIAMGIYADSGSFTPGALLEQVASSTYTVAAATSIIGTLATPLALSPGLAWVAVGTSANIATYAAGTLTTFGPQSMLSIMGTDLPTRAVGNINPAGGAYVAGVVWASPWTTLPSTAPAITSTNNVPFLGLKVQ